MEQTASNPTMRNLIVLLAVVAGILGSAIFVTAKSPSRLRAEAALAQAKSEAEDARKEFAQRIETLEGENADLRKQLEQATASLNVRAEKLAVAEQEVLRLRGELDAALKKMAEQTQIFDARIKKAEEAAAAARDAERKARLEAAAAKQEAAETILKGPAAGIDAVRAGNKKHGRANGENNNVSANKRHGPVASLPRTCPSFSELDTNHDGRLSLNEYKVGFPDAVDVEKEFKALDTNGDGTLSIDEYKAGHPDPPVVPTRRPRRN